MTHINLVDPSTLHSKHLRVEYREPRTCTWTAQNDIDLPDTYETGCGELWSFPEGGSPSEHGARFCCHCGGRIEVKS